MQSDTQAGEPARVEPGEATHRRSVPAYVTLKPLASGLPFGFFGLVAAATIVGVQAYGFLPPQAGKAIGLLLLATFVLQLIGGISCIVGRDVISASLMLVFSTTWLVTALVYLVHPVDGLVSLGLWYFALGPVIICLIVSATGKLALSLVPMTGLPAFIVTGVWLIGNAHDAFLGEVVGVLSFLLAASGLYAGLALLLEDSRRRTVLPTLRRGPMREAFTGDFDAQLRDLEHEAGVRRYV